MSSTKHPLELVLLNHLGTDDAALAHLSEIILVLGQPGIFDSANSGVLGKWNARISSLLHSREAASRWVGLVLAKHTAEASRNILIENAQGWKTDPFPNYHAVIRLLACLFTSVMDMPEFQRQVAIPNAQKCSTALLALAKGEDSDLGLKVLAIDTLTLLTTHHPTHHRALQQSLQTLTLDHLQGSFPIATSSSTLVSAVIRLHTALPLTGGKVGASVAWRKSVDSAIGTIWTLLSVLRRSYGDVIPPTTVPPPFALPVLPEDPATAAPLALDRLRCIANLLAQLLSTPTARPVSVPLGSLSQLALGLLRCTSTSSSEPTQPYEPIQRVVEDVFSPQLCIIGCTLTQQLVKTSGKYFTSYVPRFLNTITYQLDQSNISSIQRQYLFSTASALLEHTYTPAPSEAYTRLASHAVKSLAPLLPSASREKDKEKEPGEGDRKGKKRARYEADELFAPTSSSTPTSTTVLEPALDALSHLLPTLPLSTRTTIQRTLLTMLLHNPSNARVASVYAQSLIEGSTASGLLGVSVRALQPSASKAAHQLLHPRIPPMSGSGPSVDDLVLWWKEDEKEDDEAVEFRKHAGIVTTTELIGPNGPEVEMVDVLKVSDPPARTALPEFDSPVVPRTTLSSAAQSLTLSQSTSTPTTAGATPFGSQALSTSLAPPSQVQSTLSSTQDPISTPAYSTSSSAQAHSITSSRDGSQTSKAASSSLFSAPAVSSSTQLAPAVTSTIRSPLPTYEDDDDEPIPQIDLGSDTDDDGA
ncbi:rRNA processing/ribosome biogenesis [Ceratobasidium sp. AG-Ba]|nr:rRNA processing/ribosome biogenesis [Ceratobasidium sp. AG-Ba]